MRKADWKITPEKYLNREELSALLVRADELKAIGEARGRAQPIRDWMIIQTFLMTGLRRREVCDLQCVDFRIFGGNSLAAGAVDLRVTDGAVTATEAWTTKDMLARTGGYCLVDGYVYGSNTSSWACIDFKTGQKKWNEPGVGMGSLMYADGLLYTIGETSHKVALVKASPDGFTVVSEFALPKMDGLGKDPLWAYPAIANGRLYIRFWDVLFCYDIKGEGRTEAK